MKVKKLKMSPEKLISLFLFFFFISYSGGFQVNATNARPIQVAWRDAEGSQEVPLESLHGIVARDTPLCLALLRGLRDWKTSRVVSGIWVAQRHFRPAE